MPAKVTKITKVRRATTPKPATPTTQPPVETSEPSASEPEQIVVQVALVFTVDGKAVAHAPLMAQVPRPADDQALQLQVALDARVLMQWLEPHLGPSLSSAPQVAKLWVPGK